MTAIIIPFPIARQRVFIQKQANQKTNIAPTKAKIQSSQMAFTNPLQTDPDH